LTSAGSLIQAVGRTIEEALPADSTALAQALSDLDLAVRALSAQRHRLELRLASLLPVYRLPHKTVGSIFSHCVPTTEEVEGGTATPAAFAFSQVSRFWRSVALDAQALWTAPLFQWPRLAHAMIRRAGDAPLVIACTVPVFGSPARKAALDTALSAALARFEQIRRLTLRGEVDFVEGTLDSLRGPAPLLEFLCGDADSVPENDRVRNALIFPSLFGGDAPRLKELKLGNAALHWDAGVFRTLTELSISCTKLDVGIEYENILSTLEHTPLLITLSLDTVSDHETLFEDPSGTFAPRRPLIPLPRLRKLALNDDALHTIALCQQLELSNEVDFEIRNSPRRLGAVGVAGWVLQEVASPDIYNGAAGARLERMEQRYARVHRGAQRHGHAQGAPRRLRRPPRRALFPGVRAERGERPAAAEPRHTRPCVRATNAGHAA
jgi:hypothetical protein